MSNGESITLSEATRQFISQMADEERPVFQQELSRFLRWYGRDRLIQDVTPPQVDDYVQEVQRTGGDQSRLLPLRTFLAYARDNGYTSSNLATVIKVKKTTTRKGGSAQSGSRKSEDVLFISPEGYQNLQEELETLKARRPKMAMELRTAAADKDMRENAPYDAAKEKQGKMEARIRELEAVVKKTQIMNSGPLTAARVQQGHKVVLRDLVTGEEVRYTLVNPREVDLMAGKISYGSPMGKALIERAVGDRVEVVAPQGVLHYQILHVE
ncbi:MAG: transcription elongation factor GreA [Dehalococcoidia bacterium]|nr:transcription elongation factor GreA [Dehalococcoidia bacterium]